MEIVKKNLVSIILGVVALLAICVEMFYISGKHTELKTEAQQRADVHTELENLRTRERKLPVVAEGDIPPSLSGFPTRAAIAEGEKLVKAISAESGKIYSEAVKRNERVPLVATSLPGQIGNPKPAIEFAREYPKQLNFSTPETRSASTIWKILRAGIPPTDAEIGRAREAERQRIEAELLQFDQRTGQPKNKALVDQEVANAQEQIADNIRAQSASEAQVYINTDTFAMMPFQGANPGLPPDPTTIFWAQVALWVQEDVAKAVADTNNGAKSVLDAPIKHIIKVQLPAPPAFDGATIGGGAQPGGFNPNDPNSVPSTPAGPDPTVSISPFLTVSHTGRTQSALYDVVHFDLELNVEAAKLTMVLEQLGRGQLLSINQVMSVDSLDSAMLRGMGYIYGKEPVVNVKLKMEDVFLREWTKKYMPTGVRRAMQVPDPDPAAAQAATPGVVPGGPAQ